MFHKLFSIERDELHKKISFCGIRLKIFDFKFCRSFIREMFNNANTIGTYRLFLYSNLQNLSYKEKAWFLSHKFYKTLSYFPNFKNPKSFNEKINWMKLNYYNPNEKYAIDKYEFKKYIKEKLGDGYTIPLIGVYDDVNDIDFEKLPNKFVMKTTTNGSGRGIKIIKDKSKINIDKIKAKYNNLLQDWETVYFSCLSAGYKDIKPRIIIEEYLEQLEGQLFDYKFHCFHGEPKLVLGIKNRKHGKYKYRFYTPEWEPLDIYRESKRDLTKLDKPKNYDKMLEVSKILSRDFPFVRVDFYEVDNRIYVGELTFTPKGGFGVFNPLSWDYKMGEWLDLNRLDPRFL